MGMGCDGMRMLHSLYASCTASNACTPYGTYLTFPFIPSLNTKKKVQSIVSALLLHLPPSLDSIHSSNSYPLAQERHRQIRLALPSARPSALLSVLCSGRTSEFATNERKASGRTPPIFSHDCRQLSELNLSLYSNYFEGNSSEQFSVRALTTSHVDLS